MFDFIWKEYENICWSTMLRKKKSDEDEDWTENR